MSGSSKELHLDRPRRLTPRGLTLLAALVTLLASIVGLFTVVLEKSIANSPGPQGLPGKASAHFPLGGPRSDTGTDFAEHPQKTGPASPPPSEATTKDDLPPSGIREIFPLEFTLRNGEQRVLASGDLGVALSFNRVGSVEIPTLHVRMRGREVVNHALLGPENQLEAAVDETTFLISATYIDSENQTVSVQVEIRPRKE